MTDIGELGLQTAGVWTRQQALRVMTAGEIDSLLRQGVWRVVWRGVYTGVADELDVRQRAFAASLARTGTAEAVQPEVEDEPVAAVVVAGRTAARLYELPLVDDADPATGRWEHAIDDVAVRHHGRHVTRAARGGTPRQLRRHHLLLGPDEVVCLEAGLWATSVARTLYDGTHLLRPDAHLCALDAALHRGLVEPDELDQLARRHAKHPWSATFRRRLDLADGRAESPGETLTRLLVRTHLPALRPQVELRASTGRLLARFDLGDEELRLAVEFDGVRAHAGEQMVAKDRQRDALTTAHGWTTERVTWFDVRRRQDQTTARLRAVARALRARRASA